MLCGDGKEIIKKTKKFSNYLLQLEEKPKNNKIEKLNIFKLVSTSNEWLLYLKPGYSSHLDKNNKFLSMVIYDRLPSMVCILNKAKEKETANQLDNTSYFDIIADYDNSRFDSINDSNNTNFILPFKNCKIFERVDK